MNKDWMSSHLHHVLLLRQKAIELKVLLGRSFLCPQAEHRLPTQLFLTTSHVRVQVVQQLTNVLMMKHIKQKLVSQRKLSNTVEPLTR